MSIWVVYRTIICIFVCLCLNVWGGCRCVCLFVCGYALFFECTNMRKNEICLMWNMNALCVYPPVPKILQHHENHSFSGQGFFFRYSGIFLSVIRYKLIFRYQINVDNVHFLCHYYWSAHAYPVYIYAGL